MFSGDESADRGLAHDDGLGNLAASPRMGGRRLVFPRHFPGDPTKNTLPHFAGSSPCAFLCVRWKTGSRPPVQSPKITGKAARDRRLSWSIRSLMHQIFNASDL